MNKVKVNSESKSKNRMSNLTEFRLLLKQYSNYMDELIEHDYRGYKEINDRITERFGIELKGLKILEIGCGQRYPHILMYSNQNDVTGIDLDIILNRWSPVLITKMLIKKGVKRTGKTVIRKALFDKKYYRKLKKRSGMKLNGSPKIINISADSTKFNDNEFDFITSYNVFEHIENVEGVVKEMKRILKPGGVFAVVINIYTSLHGGHNCFDIYEAEGRADEMPAWDHLRNHLFPPGTYLNELRIRDYKRVFEGYFEDLHYIEDEAERNRKYLTDEICNELSDYSIHELLVNELWILGRKSSEN